MSYWKEVGDIVKKGIDLAVEGIKEGADTAIDKTKDSVQYANLRKDLFLKQRELQNILADLGDTTHVLYKEKKDIYADNKMQELMKKTIEIENECKLLEDKIQSLFKEDNKKEK